MGIARLALSAKPLTRPSTVLVRGYLDVLIVAALAALFLITFVIRTFYIPSVSMVPTLQVNDVLLVDEIAYRLHSPGDGDVAIFTPPFGSGGRLRQARHRHLRATQSRFPTGPSIKTALPFTSRTKINRQSTIW